MTICIVPGFVLINLTVAKAEQLIHNFMFFFCFLLSIYDKLEKNANPVKQIERLGYHGGSKTTRLFFKKSGFVTLVRPLYGRLQQWGGGVPSHCLIGFLNSQCKMKKHKFKSCETPLTIDKPLFFKKQEIQSNFFLNSMKNVRFSHKSH